jgi:hypothetical protein
LGAGIPADHPTVELFIEDLRDEPPPQGWADDLGLTMRAVELLDAAGR